LNETKIDETKTKTKFKKRKLHLFCLLFFLLT